MTALDLASITRAFRATDLPAVSLERGCQGTTLDELREIAAAIGWVPFEIAHRGRYASSRDAVPPDALDDLTAVARACAGGTIRAALHRWVRFERGDYSLSSDDAAWARALTPGGVHLVVDLSEVATGEAEVVFTHRGQAFFTVPQRPGELAVVERGPTVSRYDRYLTHRVGEASVTRLEIGFARE